MGHDRQARQVDIIALDDHLLTRAAVDLDQGPRPPLEHGGQLGNDVGRRAPEHPCLGGAVDEEQIDQPPVRVSLEVLEDDGPLRLGGQRRDMVERDRLLDVQEVVAVGVEE